MKKSKKIRIITVSICSSILIAGSLSTGIVFSNQNNQNSISKIEASTDADVSSLTASETNFQTKNISTNSGPVTYWGSTISGLDWYGIQRWSLDTKTYLLGINENYSVFSEGNYWSRYWYDWDYDATNDVIWILACWNVNQKSNGSQILFEVDNKTGLPLKYFEIPQSTVAYRNLKLLSSGTILFWNGPNYAVTRDNWIAAKFNTSTEVFTTTHGNVGDYVPDDSSYSSYDKAIWQINNIIPIANNLNILISAHGVDSSLYSSDGTGTDNYATYDVYGYLVNDDLNLVTNATLNMNQENQTSNRFLVSSGLSGFTNSATSPQKEYATLLNGNIVTVIYNKIILIDPSNISSIVVTNTPISQINWIKSWALDSDENLYYKFRQNAQIYKISSSSLKSETNVGQFNSTTYFDVAGSNDSDVSSSANDFIIYNITGSTTGTIGSIMLIKQSEQYDVKDTDALADNESTLYGLAIAIVANDSDSNSGDILGILNYGDNAINQPANFDIDQSVLNSKIPSEITQDDLTLYNDAFFSTSNTSYVPFTISNIDDTKGTFTITANLYQIPWFTQTLPSGSTPTTIEKTFQTTLTISNKTSWKTLSESTDYDFMNMKPSNIQVSDLQNLDPFQVSFQSQTITSSSGDVLYPKKTYSVGDKDDSTGKVTVNVTYSYVPMGVTYSNGSDNQVLTYSTSYEYTIFKTGGNAVFYFMGVNQANASGASVDVSSVSQLKGLLEANVLPSTYTSLNDSTDATNSAFLQFIDTSNSKGYPISKMTFTVSANDTNGTLTIIAVMPADYAPDNIAHTFQVTYTGLNKVSNYSFSFISSANSLGTTLFSNMLASEVSEGDIINYLITYTGYNSNDFTISEVANDTSGILTVSVSLSTSYDTSIGNSSHGFTNYVTTSTFSGFMTTTLYNERFTITFKDDEDASLIDLKLLQADEVYNSLSGQNPSGLTINGVEYTNLNDLVENLLVDSIGTSIPTGWKDSSEITTTMYYDNSQGNASFLVNIPQDLLSGASSDLNLIVNYTGFVKGNVDQTEDNLSFISDNMLENYLVAKSLFNTNTYSQLTPVTFANWIESDNNILNLITYSTGQYSTKLNNNDFTYSVIVNEVQKTVTVTIDFGTMTNSLSLSEYSIQYTI